MSSSPCVDLSFVPKRAMNYNNNEMARALRLTQSSASFISFKLPIRQGSLASKSISDPQPIPFDSWAQDKILKTDPV